MQLIANNNQQTKNTKYSYNVKKEVTQSDTPWVNIQNAPHSRHFYRSAFNQPVGHYKESSDW